MNFKSKYSTQSQNKLNLVNEPLKKKENYNCLKKWRKGTDKAQHVFLTEITNFSANQQELLSSDNSKPYSQHHNGERLLESFLR